MDGKGPPKTAVILATPINVEESKAQRLQRQQSRFRDRGGIFVPSSRNTLANILLGKASPLKKPRRSRSRSVSPCKAKSHAKASEGAAKELDPSTIKPISRKSPQKQARKSAQPAEESQTKPTARKSTGASKKATQPVQDRPPPAAKGASAKLSKTPVEKATSKPKSKSKRPNDGDVEGPLNDDSAGVVPKTKSKGVVKIVAKEPPNTLSKATVPNASNSTSVVAAEGSKPVRPKPRKSSDLYSGGSEDEYVPKQPKPRKSTANSKPTAPSKGATSSSSKTISKPVPPKTGKTKGDASLSDIAEEDEDEDQGVRQTSVRKQTDVPLPSTKPDKKGKKRASPDADEDGDDVAPPKKRPKNNSDKAEPAAKPKPASRKKASKGSKKPLPQPELENEVDEVPKKGSAKREKAVNSEEPKITTKSRKKTSPKQVPVEDPVEEPRKKVTKKLEAELPKKSTTTKRARNPDSEESTAEKPAKRKKVVDGESEPSQTTTKATLVKKPISKSAPKSSSANETVKPVAKTADSKKSSSAPVRRAPRSGPPKSVLQRIQNFVPHELDNEPDPIDFLS